MEGEEARGKEDQTATRAGIYTLVAGLSGQMWPGCGREPIDSADWEDKEHHTPP